MGELAALRDTNRVGTVSLESALDQVSGVGLVAQVSVSVAPPFSAWMGIRYNLNGRISDVAKI